jgi:ferredoxin
VKVEEPCDDDDEDCLFEIGPDGRLAEPLEAAIPSDYYSLLQLDFDADASEVKAQYRQLQKWCHPDIAGEAGTEVCIILNEAYDTLMDETSREVYDRDLKELQKLANLAAADGSDFKPYTGQPLSAFVGSDPSGEQRAVFVNESACIGCRQCNHSAPNTFFMEEDWGRARAFQQWADDEEDITIAIESCPVDCIYWVKQRNLPILEYAMQRCERAPVAMMNSGNMTRVGDPFDVANSMIRRGEEARARLGLDPGTAAEGAAATGKIGARIRDAFLKLGDNVRGRWSAYDRARESMSATFDSMDEGDAEGNNRFEPDKSFFDFE